MEKVEKKLKMCNTNLYSENQKFIAYAMYKIGTPICEIKKTVGCSGTAARRWIRKYKTAEDDNFKIKKFKGRILLNVGISREELVKLYEIHMSGIKVEKALATRGINISSVSILKAIPPNVKVDVKKKRLVMREKKTLTRESYGFFLLEPVVTATAPPAVTDTELTSTTIEEMRGNRVIADIKKPCLPSESISIPSNISLDVKIDELEINK